ncbi:MAG TPA: rhomboid family intramembrane serine protease [Rhizomicrobium sp.]
MAGFGRRGVVKASVVAVAAPAVPAITMPEFVDAPTRAPVRVFSAQPISTVLILLLLVFVYVQEIQAAPPLAGLAPSLHTQLAFGALNANAVWHEGQWWRLFTAPLMHGSLAHIIGNGVVLAIIGFMLEPLIGSAWFAAIFFVGAFGGATGSLLYNPSNIVGTGASGAIMALVVATFVFSLHEKASPRSTRMQYVSARLALPAILPAFTTASSHIDYNAHIGGALAGVVMGLLLMLLWPPENSRPAYRSAALAVVLLGLMASAFGFHEAGAAPLPETLTASDESLIPEASLPTDLSSGIDKSADLVTRYPHDPRAHLFRGAYFAKLNDVADAGDQFRMALVERSVLPGERGERFEIVLRILYATTLVAQDQSPEARDIAAPACQAAGEVSNLANALNYLHSAKVCTD